MPETVDIQQVISTSTSSVSIDDLTKKGFKQVKVLNQTVITRLIAEAVDRVLEDKSRQISQDEREKVIRESRAEFEALAKRRIEQERLKIEDLQKSKESLLSELEIYRKQKGITLELQAERDGALKQLQTNEQELSGLRTRVKEQESLLARSLAEIENLGRQRQEQAAGLETARARVVELESEKRRQDEQAADLARRLSECESRAARLEKELAGTRRAQEDLEATRGRFESEASSASRELESYRKRTEELEASCRKHDEEASRLRESLATAEKGQAMLAGQLEAKNQELERLASQQSSGTPLAETLLATIQQRLEQMAKPSEVSDIKLALDGLTRRLGSFSGGQGGSADSDLENAFRLESLFSDSSEDRIESNVSQVKIKQAKAGDVRGALAKLKRMQQGGEDGEE